MNNKQLMDVQEPNQIDYSSQIEIAKDSIFSFMELERIPLICYIDDRADISAMKNEYIGSIIAIYNSPEKPKELDFVDWSVVPLAKFSVKISEDWESFSSQEKKDCFLKLSVYNKDSNFIPALMIQNILGDKIRLFSPKEWVEDEYNIVKTLNEGQRILCLFDIEFEGEAKLESGRDGLDLAKHLLDSEHLNSCVCGVFSHLFSIEEEDDKRNQYSMENELPKEKFYTISKERFAYDPKISAFAEGIKNLILLPYIESLKDKSITTFESSFGEVRNKILNISPKTFNQIVQKSSLKEGIWEINTLFRLYNIITKEENFNIISDPENRKVFNEDVYKIRDIDLIETGYNSSAINQQLINLRNSELYLQSEIINRLHLPITNGDIFEIKDKEYILLVQPCNLALRAHRDDCGKRDYNYDTGILIPLKHIEKGRLNINMEEVKVSQIKEKTLVSYFPDFQTISLNILDLVVFNEDGSTLIDLNNVSLTNDVIHFPWKKRYEYIHKNFINYEIKINEFLNLGEGFELLLNQKKEQLKTLKEKKLKTEVKALSKEIGTLKSNFENTYKNISNIEDLRKFKIDCTKIYNPETKIIDFQIKRKRHYKNPYSDDLLQKFMQYLSRNAFDHDFTS